MKRLTEKAEKRLCELDEFAFRLLAIVANSYLLRSACKFQHRQEEGKRKICLRIFTALC